MTEFSIGSATATIKAIHAFSDQTLYISLNTTIGGKDVGSIEVKLYVGSEPGTKKGFNPASDTTKSLVRELYESVARDTSALYSETEADHDKD